MSHLDQQHGMLTLIVYYIVEELMTTYLEPGALTSPGLLLDGHDLEHLVLQTRTQEEVDDLRLL